MTNAPATTQAPAATQTPATTQTDRRPSVSARSLRRRLTTSVVAALLLATLTLGGIEPAAAVTPVVVKPNGDVVITGDNGAQYVEIERQADGGYHVEYRSGDFQGFYNFNEIRRDLIIKLKGGSDFVFIDTEASLPVGRNLLLDLGNGVNTVDARSGFDTGGNLKLVDGSGSASIELWNSNVVGTTTISLGNGTHTGEINYNDFGRNFKMITGGNGRVDMELVGNQHEGSTTIRTGNQADVLRLGGDFGVNIPLVFDGPSTLIDLRGGNDRIDVLGITRFNSRTSIRFGGGHDQMAAVDMTTGTSFSLRADGGNDSVVISASRFGPRVTLNGGGGRDSLLGEGNTFQTQLRITSFEIQ